MSKNYFIKSNPNIDLNLDYQTVALVVDRKTNEVVLPIVMENEAVTGKNPAYECSLTRLPNKMYCVQISRKKYDEWLVKKPQFFECSVMHELGHYLYKHLDKGYGGQASEYRRFQDIMNNKVTKEEYEADCFAVSELGKSVYLNSLNYLSSFLSKCAYRDYENEIIQKEIALRKKAIQKL